MGDLHKLFFGFVLWVFAFILFVYQNQPIEGTICMVGGFIVFSMLK
jgi:hypothetical protein